MNKIGAAIFTLCILVVSASAQTDSRNAVRRLGNCITVDLSPMGNDTAAWKFINQCSQTIHVFWMAPDTSHQDAELSPGSDYKNAVIFRASPGGVDTLNWVACPPDYSLPDSAKFLGWTPEIFDLDVCLPGFVTSLNEHPPAAGSYPVSPLHVAPSIRLPPP